MRVHRLVPGVFFFLLCAALAGAATVTVDYDTGGKVQTALKARDVRRHNPRPRHLQRNLSVRDELARLTLDVQGSAAVRATSSTAPAIQVLGRGITIHGFTINVGATASAC